MNRNYFLWIVYIALFCLALVFLSLWWDIESPIKKEVITPPVAPYKSNISGVGIVEPSSDNIFIGTPVSRIVDHIYVKVNQKVKKGDTLFSLENREIKADLQVQQTALAVAEAKLKRLEAFPQQEDLEASKANLETAQAEEKFAKDEYEMVLKLTDQRAISQEEKNRRLFNLQQAEGKLQQAQAHLTKLQAGTWKPDLEIARLQVEQAKAGVERLETELARTFIHSPIDGTVLQIKINEGELPPPDTSKNPLMILGDTDELFLRTTINQLDIPYYHSNASAVAFLQDDAKNKYPLEFIRIEPYLVNKQHLTNDVAEKVDTRVLQIIYKIAKKDPSLFVGQQMDVFIESKLH